MTTEVTVLRSTLTYAVQLFHAIQNVSGEMGSTLTHDNQLPTIQNIVADGLKHLGETLQEGAQASSDLMPEAMNPAAEDAPYLPLTRDFDERAIEVRLNAIDSSFGEFDVIWANANFSEADFEFFKTAPSDLRAVLREMKAQRTYARQYAEMLDIIEVKMKLVFPNSSIPFMTHVENHKQVVQQFAAIWQRFQQSGFQTFAAFFEYNLKEDELDPLFEQALRVVTQAQKTQHQPEAVANDSTIIDANEAFKAFHSDSPIQNESEPDNHGD